MMSCVSGLFSSLPAWLQLLSISASDIATQSAMHACSLLRMSISYQACIASLLHMHPCLNSIVSSLSYVPIASPLWVLAMSVNS